MMAEFRMPTLGADMSEGTLVSWKKKPGDSVKKGEIIAEVDTDKAIIEIEVFTNGVIEKVLVPPGEKVPVGTVLAIIREDGPARGARLEPSQTETAPQGVSPVPLASIPTEQVETGRVRISPLARRKAQELGIDPAILRGTGPNGSITEQDVLRAVQARGQGPETRGVETVSPIAQGAGPITASEDMAARQARMRQAIAAAMARSKREIPHYYLSTTIDMERAMAWLADANLKRPVPDRLLYGVLLIKAVALALRELPELNAVWKGGQAVPSADIHVGIAISLRQGGLVAPALHHTDRRSLSELMRDFRDLVKRARAGSLRSSELSDPTITVTSLGEQGVETVFGVIYPPQVALVGFGKVVTRPWVSGGNVVSRQLISATLSADHRVTDGHRGGLFLAAVDRLLQEPERL
jgi:pyruvate dehydrogenase E2 component (dihydrolipoamide acetyltransferase)